MTNHATLNIDLQALVDNIRELSLQTNHTIIHAPQATPLRNPMLAFYKRVHDLMFSAQEMADQAREIAARRRELEHQIETTERPTNEKPK